MDQSKYTARFGNVSSLDNSQSDSFNFNSFGNFLHPGNISRDGVMSKKSSDRGSFDLGNELLALNLEVVNLDQSAMPIFDAQGSKSSLRAKLQSILSVVSSLKR